MTDINSVLIQLSRLRYIVDEAIVGSSYNEPISLRFNRISVNRLNYAFMYYGYPTNWIIGDSSDTIVVRYDEFAANKVRFNDAKMIAFKSFLKWADEVREGL